ncbi:ESX secretion-associated protein EspG [Nocardia colli]|uniref:ESX secretion-associated protein EspG n=1 Tax=Nocardia colli TaxID=2545717 RepID=A0A5N0DYZ1_9NOCA|nr:ESX secretion-associated protein EspG [Nocardia colli]KAA8881916.1 ESX secretion-associated protein EspG [Nocardia colli]
MTDPVAIDLNVDAALVLQDMVGIDAYPAVLAVLPNIYQLADRDRVRAVVLDELATAGIVEDDRVHPTVERWLHCLYRPDVELVARIVAPGREAEPLAMLRLSLVRCGESHVMAVRCDDHIVIESIFQPPGALDTVTAALAAALGPWPALEFEPMTALLSRFAQVPAEREERRQALLGLGATAYTAGVLSRVLDEIDRRAEVLMIEHRDGSLDVPELCLSVLDTREGRVIVTPRVAMDGAVWSTYAPGDDAVLRAGVAALVELLPGGSWFDTTRTE